MLIVRKDLVAERRRAGINISLDTLDPDKFHAVTRWGKFDKVMAGIDAAQEARRTH